MKVKYQHLNKEKSVFKFLNILVLCSDNKLYINMHFIDKKSYEVYLKIFLFIDSCMT